MYILYYKDVHMIESPIYNYSNTWNLINQTFLKSSSINTYHYLSISSILFATV